MPTRSAHPFPRIAYPATDFARRSVAQRVTRHDRGQRERVLAALVKVQRGITQADFLPPGIIDGGKPIARLASRIDELRQEGVPIVGAGWRSSFKVYRLDLASADAGSTPDKPQQPLF